VPHTRYETEGGVTNILLKGRARPQSRIPTHRTLQSIDSAPDWHAHGAFDCVDYRAKLGQQAIAHELEYSPMAARDFRFEQLFASCAQSLVGSGLIALQVTHDISSENVGELTFHC
jgi:hypothetical protein